VKIIFNVKGNNAAFDFEFFKDVTMSRISRVKRFVW